jgi:hypothetical protein
MNFLCGAGGPWLFPIGGELAAWRPAATEVQYGDLIDGRLVWLWPAIPEASRSAARRPDDTPKLKTPTEKGLHLHKHLPTLNCGDNQAAF